jgi:hypothetical protein
MSSVEIVTSPELYDEPVGGYDRSQGKGVGHLFELDFDGNLLRHLTLGEGSVYHPGGVDFDDEQSVWVPVAEYRPDSCAIVYRVDTRTFVATEVFRFADHLGGIVRDRDTGLLYAVTWGSRRLVTLTTDGHLLHATSNKSNLIDFQGCVCVHDSALVCTGVTEYRDGSGGLFQLGGAGAIDVETGYLRAEVPVTAMTPHGRVVTYNAAHFEVEGDCLRMIVADGADDADDHGLLLTMETKVEV